MQLAENKNIPIFLCYRDFGQRVAPVKYRNPDHSSHDLQVGEGFVTLMAAGVPSVFRSFQYSDSADGIDKILSVIDILHKT